MIPEPKSLHAISLSAFTALGEGYFFAGHFGEAIAAFRAALQAPGGIENPLTYLRLGQAYFDDGEFDRAADALTRAYALGGATIFDGEDEKYLAFLATRIEL